MALSDTATKVTAFVKDHRIVQLVLVLVVGLAIGRFSLPAKVVIQDKIVYQNVTNTDTNTNKQVDKNVVTTVTETDKPDGTKVTTTVTQDKSTVDAISNTDTNSTTNSTTTETKTTTYNTGKFGIELGAALNSSLGPSAYIHPTMDVIGPFFIGVHAQMGATPELGLGVGIRF